MRIVLCYPVSAHHVQQIAGAYPGAEVIDAGQERIAAELATADIYCGHHKVPVPWPEVLAAGRLQWIQSSAAGVDHCLVPEVVASDIPVTSASGVLADQVAEHTIGLILSLCRSLPLFQEQQRRREFVRRPTRDLHRATVGIIGYGGVGRRLAQIVSSFSTRVLATDKFPPAVVPPHVAAVWPADELDRLLAESDIVVLCAPLNSQTRGMIHAGRLAQMKPGALLVNVARGPLVIEADLVAALESGHLGGAALDVTEVEPLPQNSKLWDMPGVVITPHVGGQSARRIDDMTDFFCDNLRRWQAGLPLRNVVDKQLGYPTPALNPPQPADSRC